MLEGWVYLYLAVLNTLLHHNHPNNFASFVIAGYGASKLGNWPHEEPHFL